MGKLIHLRPRKDVPRRHNRNVVIRAGQVWIQTGEMKRGHDGRWVVVRAGEKVHLRRYNERHISRSITKQTLRTLYTEETRHRQWMRKLYEQFLNRVRERAAPETF